MKNNIILSFHKTKSAYVTLPVSHIASFNFFPPRVTYLTLKSTPALCSKESMQINEESYTLTYN